MTTHAQAAATESVLLRQDAKGVATLTLNRPAQFNSLSQALMRELQVELDRIDGRDSFLYNA